METPADDVVERAGYLLYGGVFDIGLLSLGKWSDQNPDTFGLCFAAGARVDEAQRATTVGDGGRDMAVATLSALSLQLQVVESVMAAAAERSGTNLRRAPGQPRREYSGCVALWNTASTTTVRGVVRNKQVLYIGEFDLSRSSDGRGLREHNKSTTVVRPETTLRFDERGGGDLAYLQSNAGGTAMARIPPENAAARREAVHHAVHATIMVGEASDRGAVALGLPSAGRKRKLRSPRPLPPEKPREPHNEDHTAGDVLAASGASTATDPAIAAAASVPTPVPSGYAGHAYYHPYFRQHWAPPPSPFSPQMGDYWQGYPGVGSVPAMAGLSAPAGRWHGRGAEEQHRLRFSHVAAPVAGGGSGTSSGGGGGGGGGEGDGGDNAGEEAERSGVGGGGSELGAETGGCGGGGGYTAATPDRGNGGEWSGGVDHRGGEGRAPLAWDWRQGPQHFEHPPPPFDGEQLRSGILEADRRLRGLMADAMRIDQQIDSARAELDALMRQHGFS
ncbi:unnamed protein product [Phaeothamnion confervicola]